MKQQRIMPGYVTVVVRPHDTTCEEIAKRCGAISSFLNGNEVLYCFETQEERAAFEKEAKLKGFRLFINR